MQRYIGIDLGGTNIKGALVSETGKILKQRSVPTHAEEGAEAVAKAIAAMICALAEGESVSGVGMGCPGTVDDREGTVVYACNLGWVHYDVRTALRVLTGYSVRLVNDANAAALAEAAVGAAKGAQSAVVVTLGTGVGGGVVLSGKLLTTALIRMTREAMARHPQSALHRIAAENGGVDGRTAFLARQVGDAAGGEVIRQYIHYLAIGVGNIVNIFFPEVVALSGGIANQGENLLTPLREEVAQREYGAAYSKKHPRILCCTLGNDAGVIGAALFAKD